MVAKTRNYDIFVAKIYDYALIDRIWGFPGFIDSPTSYATLVRYLQNLGADLLGIGYFLLWKESNTIVNQDIRDRPYIAKWYIRDKCVNIDPQ